MVERYATSSQENEGRFIRRVRHRQNIPWPAFAFIFLLLCACLRLNAAYAADSAQGEGASITQNSASPAQLADLLENEQTRNQLIAQLRAQAPKAETGSAPGTGRQSAVAGTRESLPQRIAGSTQLFLEHLVSDAGQAVATLTALLRGDGAATDMRRWGGILQDLAVVIVVTIAAFVLLRLLAARAFARISIWVAHIPVTREHARISGSAAYRKAVAVAGSLAVDVAAIFLAGVAGYAAGLYGVGERSAVGTLGLFFVNAFIAVEIARALVRTVFATRFPRLRLFAMPDDVAAYWSGWLSRLVSLTGYGMLVVVPVATALLSATIGQVVGLFIMLSVYVYAVRFIWKNRVPLRDRLIERAKLASTAFFATLIRMLSRVWHVLAIGYFTVLLVVSQIAPNDALPFMARATAQSVLAIALGLLLSAILTSLLTRHIHLSEEVRARLPLLETRINAYVPTALKGLRVIIMITVLLIVLDAWRAFNLSAWIASASGRAAIEMIVHVAIILLCATLVWTIIATAIENRLSASAGRIASPRETTLLSLFRNAALIVIVTMTAMVVLSQIGVNIGPLIAGAGVIGLAVGFGAQKLVQDIITGVFIQLENGMNVNDVVEAAGVFGTVEKMTIRSVGIRTLDGGYHLIPFSSVDVVANHMRDFSYHYGEYTIAHRESVDDAMHHMREAFKELAQDEVLAPEILGDISIPGVTALNERGVTIRVLIKTMPGMQWAVQRAFNRLIKKHFDAADIELPYPHTVMYFGENKNGSAPAANVNIQAVRERPAQDV